jgi:hypothetical protein
MKKMFINNIQSNFRKTVANAEGKKDSFEKVNALVSINSAFTAGVYGTEWYVWFFVGMALFFAVFWSREKLESMQSYYHVRRLYGIAGVGIAVLLVAILSEKTSLLVPVGMGTTAIVLAGIVDIIRPALISAHQRLLHIMQAIIATLTGGLFLATVLDWKSSYIPLTVLIVALVIRYVVFKSATSLANSRHFSSIHFFSRV